MSVCVCARNSCGAFVRWAVCCWHVQKYSTLMQKSMSIFFMPCHWRWCTWFLWNSIRAEPYAGNGIDRLGRWSKDSRRSLAVSHTKTFQVEIWYEGCRAGRNGGRHLFIGNGDERTKMIYRRFCFHVSFLRRLAASTSLYRAYVYSLEWPNAISFPSDWALCLRNAFWLPRIRVKWPAQRARVDADDKNVRTYKARTKWWPTVRIRMRIVALWSTPFTFLFRF